MYEAHRAAARLVRRPFSLATLRRATKPRFQILAWHEAREDVWPRRVAPCLSHCGPPIPISRNPRRGFVVLDKRLSCERHWVTQGSPAAHDAIADLSPVRPHRTSHTTVAITYADGIAVPLARKTLGPLSSHAVPQHAPTHLCTPQPLPCPMNRAHVPDASDPPVCAPRNPFAVARGRRCIPRATRGSQHGFRTACQDLRQACPRAPAGYSPWGMCPPGRSRPRSDRPSRFQLQGRSRRGRAEGTARTSLAASETVSL